MEGSHTQHKFNLSAAFCTDGSVQQSIDFLLSLHRLINDTFAIYVSKRKDDFIIESRNIDILDKNN
jgi:hypothetical protein